MVVETLRWMIEEEKGGGFGPSLFAYASSVLYRLALPLTPPFYFPLLDLPPSRRVPPLNPGTQTC